MATAPPLAVTVHADEVSPVKPPSRKNSVDSLDELERMLCEVDGRTPPTVPQRDRASVNSIEAEAFALGIVSKMLPEGGSGSQQSAGQSTAAETKQVSQGPQELTIPSSPSRQSHEAAVLSPSSQVKRSPSRQLGQPATPESVRQFSHSVDALLG